MPAHLPLAGSELQFDPSPPGSPLSCPVSAVTSRAAGDLEERPQVSGCSSSLALFTASGLSDASDVLPSCPPVLVCSGGGSVPITCPWLGQVRTSLDAVKRCPHGGAARWTRVLGEQATWLTSSSPQRGSAPASLLSPAEWALVPPLHPPVGVALPVPQILSDYVQLEVSHGPSDVASMQLTRFRVTDGEWHHLLIELRSAKEGKDIKYLVVMTLDYGMDQVRGI